MATNTPNPDREPTLADLIEEHIGYALVGCPDDADPREFLGAPEFEQWTDGHDTVTIESVAHSLGWLRGAAEAFNVTIMALCDDHGVTVPNRRALRRARRA